MSFLKNKKINDFSLFYLTVSYKPAPNCVGDCKIIMFTLLILFTNMLLRRINIIIGFYIC